MNETEPVVFVASEPVAEPSAEPTKRRRRGKPRGLVGNLAARMEQVEGMLSRLLSSLEAKSGGLPPAPQVEPLPLDEVMVPLAAVVPPVPQAPPEPVELVSPPLPPPQADGNGLGPWTWAYFCKGCKEVAAVGNRGSPVGGDIRRMEFYQPKGPYAPARVYEGEIPRCLKCGTAFALHDGRHVAAMYVSHLKPPARTVEEIPLKKVFLHA